MGSRIRGLEFLGVMIIIIGVLLLLSALGVPIGNVVGAIIALGLIVLGLYVLWNSLKRKRPSIGGRFIGNGREQFVGSIHVSGPD